MALHDAGADITAAVAPDPTSPIAPNDNLYPTTCMSGSPISRAYPAIGLCGVGAPGLTECDRPWIS